jgi:hypothetical protein
MMKFETARATLVLCCLCVQTALAADASLMCMSQNVPAELSSRRGGHAFGLRSTKLPIGRWPALVEQWLYTSGVLSL